MNDAFIDHKAKKRLATDSALTKRPPTQEERFLIHDLYLNYSQYDDPQAKTKKPDDVEWLADTKMSAIHIMQPQDRNIHDKVLIQILDVFDMIMKAVDAHVLTLLILFAPL